MNKMSKERAIALLGTAKNLLSPEDMRRFIDSALVQLRTDVEPIEALEMARDMIEEALLQLGKNLPDERRDSPEDLAEKMAICESALLQIKEYAAMGLKARAQGSLDVAEDLLRGQVNRSLQEFSEPTSVTLETEGKSVTVGQKEIERLERVIANDPRINALGGE
jgi:hypothetical protein